jgi:hypothetical protein
MARVLLHRAGIPRCLLSQAHRHHTSPSPSALTTRRPSPAPAPPPQESQSAIRYAAQLFFIPLATGFLISRALAGPILDYIMERNPEAFAMTDHQVRG